MQLQQWSVDEVFAHPGEIPPALQGLSDPREVCGKSSQFISFRWFDHDPDPFARIRERERPDDVIPGGIEPDEDELERAARFLEKHFPNYSRDFIAEMYRKQHVHPSHWFIEAFKRGAEKCLDSQQRITSFGYFGKTMSKWAMDGGIIGTRSPYDDEMNRLPDVPKPAYKSKTAARVDDQLAKLRRMREDDE